jgi:hypothetical protein
MLSRLTARRCLVALALAVSVAVAAARPAWAASAGLDVWNLPDLDRQTADATEESRDLDARDAEVRERIDLKERLVENLVAGRTTLAEVAAQFVALNESRPEYARLIRETYPGATEEEKVARHVVENALLRLAGRPAAERAEVAARLDGELRRLAGDPAAPGTH